MTKLASRLAAFAGLLLAALALTAPSAFAFANPNNHGRANNARGFASAFNQCDRLTSLQTEHKIMAGGGPKAGVLAPTNCDHFWPPPGQSKN